MLRISAFGEAEDVHVDAVAAEAMSARTEREALAKEAHGHVVVARAAMGRERHLMWPIAIDGAFAELTFAIDHHTHQARSIDGRRPRSPLLAGASGGAFAGACGRRQRAVSKIEQKGNMYSEVAVEAQCCLPDTLEELRALEREIEREWWWLHGALNAVAHIQAERSHGNVWSFREMQAQVRDVDRRRVEIAVRIAAIEARLN